MDLSDSSLLAVSGFGMSLVAVLSVICCRVWTKSKFRWLWAGAGLWFVAVALKMICALLANKSIFSILEHSLPRSLFVAVGSLFVGVSSAFFEIGLTLLAVLIWRELGRSADKAIGIGVGAGAIEAAILGLSNVATAITLYLGLPGTEEISKAIHESGVHGTSLCLVPIVERVLAILCHTSSRALVLLGLTSQRWAMVLAGIAIFTYIDTVAGFAHLSGALKTHSVWWIELAIAPAALVSIPVLRWCARNFGKPEQVVPPVEHVV